MEVLVETIGIPASIVLFILLTLAYAYLQNSAKERGDAEKVQQMTNQIWVVLAIFTLIALLVGLAFLSALVDGLSH